MEIWFWAAVAGALFAGLSNFYFKQAAARGYNAEIFSLYGSLLSFFLIFALLMIQPAELFKYHWLGILAFGGGLLAALTNVFKIYALRYIDSTIYFPLFKLLSPSIAVIAGVILFGERFSSHEWIGIIIGLTVPLLLITKSENQRQNNLILGILLILLTGLTSSSTAIANKYVIDVGFPIAVVILYATSGIFIGSLLASIKKRGFGSTWYELKINFHRSFIISASLRSGLIFFSFWFMLYAFQNGGSLAIVQTINSMYILIPIVLSVIFYKEHWNIQKVTAVILSVFALMLLG